MTVSIDWHQKKDVSINFPSATALDSLRLFINSSIETQDSKKILLRAKSIEVGGNKNSSTCSLMHR